MDCPEASGHFSAVTVMRVRPGNMPAAEFINKVLTELGRHSATQVQWQTGPGTPPAGIDQVLTGLGASVHETIDICGYALDRAFPTGSLAQGVSVQPVRSRDDVARFERTSAQAWGYPAPSEEDIDRTFANSTVGFFIGSWHGVPAGAGGYALVGDVARFWGTAVVPNSEAEGSKRTGPCPNGGCAQPRGETGPGARQADLLAHPPTTRVRRIRPAEGLVHPAIGHPDAASTTKVAPNAG